MTEETGFNSQLKQEIFLLSRVSKLALGPIHTPTQRIPGALSPIIKLSEYEADYPPPSSASPPHA